MRKPSPATIIASVALFFSLGTGAGFAAQHYLITSLSQIAPKVRHELRGQRGERGYAGPTGKAGDPGATGPQGAAASLGSGTALTCNANGTATLTVPMQATVTFSDDSCYGLQ